MDATDAWLKQHDAPLFPALLWSRPENRALGGKLLIVGGNLHGFSSVAEAYTAAARAGAGTIRIILPDALKRTVSPLMPEAEFTPSTPSGSFATAALDAIMDAVGWADGIVLSGDFGKNSETAILLERFFKEERTLTVHTLPGFWPKAPADCLITTVRGLQPVAAQAAIVLKSTMDLHETVKVTGALTRTQPGSVVIMEATTLIAGMGGKVSTTRSTSERSEAFIGGYAATLMMQFRAQPFEALSSGLWLATSDG